MPDESQVNRNRGLLWGLIAVVAAVGILLAFQLGAAINELRTRNCIAKIDAKYPVAFSEKGRGIYNTKPSFLFYGEPAKFRAASLDGC